MEKSTKFWFKKDYFFDHASGDKEYLSKRLFTVTDIGKSYYYCTDTRNRTYLLPFSINSIVFINTHKL